MRLEEKSARCLAIKLGDLYGSLVARRTYCLSDEPAVISREPPSTQSGPIEVSWDSSGRSSGGYRFGMTAKSVDGAKNSIRYEASDNYCLVVHQSALILMARVP